MNEDTRTINYTITNCDGSTQSPNLTAGSRRNHCIQGGSLIIVNSPSDALLGEYDCGTTCIVANDCSNCGPTTTTTSTTTTTTTAPPTTTSTTTTTTTPPPTTTTSTTTTTTTYAAITLNATPGCSGGAGTGTITANGFSGGSESFEYIAISSTSSSDALSRLDNSATRDFLGGATEFTYTMLANATYYVAIMDDLGNKGVSSGAVVNCTTTTTTTTSTTTTTTTPPPTTTSTTTTTTTPPPTTTTSTTTTTTTYAPIGLTATPGCSGGEGTGTITANGFNGGSESFEYIAISSTSSSDALSRLDNSATRTFLGGATEFTYTMLANATYYVAIMDNVGNKGVSSGAVVNCITTTTTTTSTTTTTTTPTPTTTTSTTTTTTTPPPTTTTSTTTTTTTLGYAFVDIANNTAGTSINNITINGVQVDGAVFPIVAGDGASATTTQTGGSRTIVVSYTNVSNDSVEVIDTASNLTCISATSTSRTFAAQVVADGGTLSVQMFDGSC